MKKKTEMNWMKKAAKSPKSRVYAMNAFCYSCVGGTIDEVPDGGWQVDIRECTSHDCPLYNFRPYKPRVVKRHTGKEE